MIGILLSQIIAFLSSRKKILAKPSRNIVYSKNCFCQFASRILAEIFHVTASFALHCINNDEVLLSGVGPEDAGFILIAGHKSSSAPITRYDRVPATKGRRSKTSSNPNKQSNRKNQRNISSLLTCACGRLTTQLRLWRSRI